jgi:glutamate-1-semialdehyde 2,1-aminomutase
MAATALSLQGWNYGEPLTLSLQTQRQHPGQHLLPPGRWQIQWHGESQTHSADFELVLALEEEGRWLEIDDLTVTLTGSTPQGELAAPLSRLSVPAPWVDDEAFLEELLAAPQNLRLLQVSGGEPLLQRRFYDLLETLVKGGHSSRIQLYISTNGMVYSRKLAQLLKEFRSVELGVSVDGYGALQEYIRYPAQWALIEQHIFAYRQDGLPASIRATPQAYNIFGLLDLARWCQKHELPFYCENILWSPRFLSLDMLPQRVINQALKDFVNFLATERDENLGRQIQTVISVLRRLRPSLGELTQLQRRFIEFTQALDESRSQGLAQACPRLYENLPYFASSFSG